MFRRKRALDRVIRRSFVVTKTDGSMFQGALLEENPDWLVFAFVKVPDGEEWVAAAEGRLYIHIDRVDYMQQVSIADVA